MTDQNILSKLSQAVENGEPEDAAALAHQALELGLDPLSIAHASLLGQMTTGFPLSPLTPATFLLIGLTGIDLADHQRFTFKYAFLTTLVMAIVSIIIGVFPL